MQSPLTTGQLSSRTGLRVKQKYVQEKAIEKTAEGGGSFLIADGSATFWIECITSVFSAGYSGSQGRAQEIINLICYYYYCASVCMHAHMHALKHVLQYLYGGQRTLWSCFSLRLSGSPSKYLYPLGYLPNPNVSIFVP